MIFLLDEPWLLSIAVCIVLIASSVLGYRVAVSTRINEDSHHHEHITGLREGLFVLLGLLLGFTVAIVLPRFDERRQLVIDEANAIGTTALRAETLPEPQRVRTLELLREYVVVRRDFATETLLDQAALDRETQRTKALQGQLWQQIVAVTQQNQTAVVATYLQALNELIDVSEKRLAAFENRVPKTVWLIIFIVAIFQSFVTGFSLKRRLWFSLVMTPIVIAVVMALLADLDSPRTGLIRIGQNSMERLVHDMTDTKR
jgi:Protein of unknown function (DUF4239)